MMTLMLRPNLTPQFIFTFLYERAMYQFRVAVGKSYVLSRLMMMMMRGFVLDTDWGEGKALQGLREPITLAKP